MSNFSNILTEEKKQAAKEADTFWQAAIVDEDLINQHPYILRKRIQPHGIRMVRDEDTLIIPVYDINGNIQTIQRIFLESEKKKLFYKDAPKKGNFFSFGNLTNSEYIFICEGYATGASIFQASNIPTVVAFDAGNLKSVTDVINKNYYHSKIIICGDDDFYKENNVGRDKALSAGEEYGCYVVFPDFTEHSKKRTPSDFNDLHVLEGLEVVTEQLNKALIDAVEFYIKHPKPKYTLPEEFKVDDSGVYYICPQTNKTSWLCSTIEATAYTSDKNDCNHGRILEWMGQNSNIHHKWAMPAYLLVQKDNSAILAKLVSEGLKVSPARKDQARIIEYLQAIQPLTRKISTSNIGWHGNSFALPNKIFPANSDIVLQTDNYADTFGAKGTLEEWQSNIARYALGNSRLIFALSLAFASPLLKLTNGESCVFHFVGASSTGKSTTLCVAASVFGGGDKSYIKQWRSTDNAKEAIAAAHCDCLLILDELGQAESKSIGETVYMLANNQGKDRMTKSISFKPAYEWRILVLSSGEITLEDKLCEAGKQRYAGMETRFISIPAAPQEGFGILEELHNFKSGGDFSVSIKDACKEYYGTPFIAFLEKLTSLSPQDFNELITNINKAQSIFQEIVLTHVDSGGQVERVAKRFSLVAAAGETAIEFGILPFPPGSAFEAVKICFQDWLKFRGSTVDLELIEGVAQVRQYLEKYGESRFILLNDIRGDKNYKAPIEHSGFRELIDGSYHYYIFPDAYQKDLCKGRNITLISNYLAVRGHLVKEKSSGKNSIPKSLPGRPKNCRVYHIMPSIFVEGE